MLVHVGVLCRVRLGRVRALWAAFERSDVFTGSTCVLNAPTWGVIGFWWMRAFAPVGFAFLSAGLALGTRGCVAEIGGL